MKKIEKILNRIFPQPKVCADGVWARAYKVQMNHEVLADR